MPFICCLDYSIDHRKHKTIGKLILFDIRETESEIHKVGRRQRYLARSDFCCLAPCPPPPPPPARSQASAEKCPGKAPPHFYLRGHGHSNEAWLCAATPPEIVARRTMDRHGIWVGRNGKAGIYQKKKHLSSCCLRVPPALGLKKLLYGLKPRSRTV